jgi:hypothetical protein
MSETQDPPYTTKTEREVAFKLIAAHALVDADYYARLRQNPRAAVAELHFLLDESDYLYLAGLPSVDGAPGVQWEAIDENIETVRSALNADTVVRSLW